ncbi:MAG: glutamate-5-semialdehyde dehydrogenase [Clostridia bacterium]
MSNVVEKCQKAKEVSFELSALTNQVKNEMLEVIASAILANVSNIIEANKLDLQNATQKPNAFIDRLTLTEQRIIAMAEGVRQVKLLPNPVGEVVESWVTKAGLQIKKVRASLGVIAVIYEARPNVTVDVASLCIKTGNAVVLRGGSDAIHTNLMLFNIMQNALKQANLLFNSIQFVDDTARTASLELLKQDKYIDVVIPRGGNGLKTFILQNATMPCIASAGGNCHIYVEQSGSLAQANDIIFNAKMQRPTVCNAMEQLLIDKAIAKDYLPTILQNLTAHGCKIIGDELTCKIFKDATPSCAEDYYCEHLDYILSVKVVEDYKQATDWVNEHSTNHSEAIISTNQKAIDYFTSKVDSACVYVNASTRFTDGFEFGFGAEIGISTQKLHARGPIGLKQLTSERYICVGNGTIRK